MTVTTIVVNYNAGEWLRRSVASALGETPGDVIVVDNASTDDSVRTLNLTDTDSDRVTVIRNKSNLGFARANNQAMSTVESDYIVLMNPDCEMQPGCWETLRAVLDEEKNIGLASCEIRNPDGSLQSTCRRRFPTPWSAAGRMLGLNRLFPNNPKYRDFDYGDQPIPDSWEAVEAISGAFMVVRTAALPGVGLLDEGYFMHCEDLDWCKRFQQAGYLVAFVPGATVIHEKGVSSRSRPVGTQWNLHRGMLRFFEKFYRDEAGLFTRVLVTGGVYISFLVRAVVAGISRIFR